MNRNGLLVRIISEIVPSRSRSFDQNNPRISADQVNHGPGRNRSDRSGGRNYENHDQSNNDLAEFTCVFLRTQR